MRFVRCLIVLIVPMLWLASFTAQATADLGQQLVHQKLYHIEQHNHQHLSVPSVRFASWSLTTPLSLGHNEVLLDFNLFTDRYEQFIAGSAYAYTQLQLPNLPRVEDQRLGMELQKNKRWSIHVGIQQNESKSWWHRQPREGYFIGTGLQVKQRVRFDFTGAVDTEDALEAMFRTSVSF